MTADARTLAAYDRAATAYADRFAVHAPGADLRRFIDLLPDGARVLDLGCGPGTASVFLRAAGHRPDPVDASPGMVAEANRRHAIGARLARFDQIEGVATYDAIWANFSLLHAARADLPGLLGRLVRSLKPGGLFHIGMKTGSGAARDRLDRLYTYLSADDLRGLLTDAGLTVLSAREGSEAGLAGTVDPYVVMLARA